MAVSNPIYTWSIADAWTWFVHVPFLGFAAMLLIAFVFAAIIAVMIDL